MAWETWDRVGGKKFGLYGASEDLGANGGYGFCQCFFMKWLGEFIFILPIIRGKSLFFIHLFKFSNFSLKGEKMKNEPSSLKGEKGGEVGEYEKSTDLWP